MALLIFLATLLGCADPQHGCIGRETCWISLDGEDTPFCGDFLNPCLTDPPWELFVPVEERKS